MSLRQHRNAPRRARPPEDSTRLQRERRNRGWRKGWLESDREDYMVKQVLSQAGHSASALIICGSQHSGAIGKAIASSRTHGGRRRFAEAKLVGERFSIILCTICKPARLSAVKPKPRNHPPSWSQSLPPPPKRPSRPQSLRAANWAQDPIPKQAALARPMSRRKSRRFSKEPIHPSSI